MCPIRPGPPWTICTVVGVRIASGLVAVAAALSAACTPAGAPGGAGPTPAGTRAAPSFAPLPAEDGSREASVETPSPAATIEGGSAADGATPRPPLPTPTPRQPLSASVRDPSGDVREDPTDPPPPYVDVLAAELARGPDGYELLLTLGGNVPKRSRDPNRATDVTSFYDVDGDGRIDYEVGASLADDGWGPAYFDDRRSESAYGEESGIEVEVRGNTLALIFPLGHLDGAERLQWAVATQYGTFTAIAAGTASSDAAPDDGGASFPADGG